MKATEANLLQFLKKSTQFSIPIYQRTYSWTEKECQQLWSDIERAGRTDSTSSHFIGSVVYIEQGVHQVSNQSPFLVIDGQQRLTTVSILLEALARHLADEEIEGFNTDRIRSYYLTNQLEDGDGFFKLLLTETDRETLCALVTQRNLPDNHSIRIAENFDFFASKLSAIGQDLPRFCQGLTKLLLVDVSLDRSHDNPQLIFESMNSTGRELSQADLIRNFILMGLESTEQTQLYRHYWRPMEERFGQEGYGRHFDSFMRHFLTIRTGEIPRVTEVYEAFKLYANRDTVRKDGVDQLVEDIFTSANHYCRMALGQETDPELAAAFRDIRELKVDVAYPFLLKLYSDFENAILTKTDFCEIVRISEAYVFRRAICAIPTNSLNKTFSTFHRSIDTTRYLDSVRAHFLLLRSYRRFPKDDEFQRDFQARDLYNFPRRSYWLRKIENEGRKERVPVDEYTIEHILPQNENLSEQWRTDLGSDWEHIQETYLHTLGNLTLTGYNSEYSDRPFAEKRDMKGGFAQSPLRLNDGLGTIEVWNEAAIHQRAQRLAKLATAVWQAPSMDESVLATFRPQPTERAARYTIDDHPYLADGTIPRKLFETFRKELLALDPCVTEEFLKQYIAYKAETNFCDVVPQARRLRLSLNMRFHALHDPRGLAIDISDRGRWGNGDVEVPLTDEQDIPYIMGLVRQSFELQMGDSSENSWSGPV